MTKKKNYINLNGTTFEYIGNGKMPTETNWTYGRNIFNAYDRPSSTKVNIWEEWYSFMLNSCRLTNDYSNNDLWIASRNCFMFTIEGTIINSETGELLGVKITREHNYCWSITE